MRGISVFVAFLVGIGDCANISEESFEAGFADLTTSPAPNCRLGADEDLGKYGATSGALSASFGLMSGRTYGVGLTDGSNGNFVDLLTSILLGATASLVSPPFLT